MIRRLLPYPGLAAALFAMWLLLAQSISPGQVMLGAVSALLATQSLARLRVESSQVRDWGQLVRLAGIVGYDIVRSNFAVALIVLTPGRQRTSGFIQLRLTLRNEHALALLALVITATPGTAWVQFDRKTGDLLIHVFDLVDEEEWVHLLKTRYEALLIKAFEA